MTQWVYRFGGGAADGRAEQKALLGGKGANLAEMTALGIPVPPGFTITTEVCNHVSETGGYPAGLADAVTSSLTWIGELTGTRFGDPERPLLVSVRSGAPASMPGMMDTILNLGLNDTTALALAQRTGDARFAWDCYRRFVAMYGEVVMGVSSADEHEATVFERLLEDARHRRGVTRDSDLPADDLRGLVDAYRQAIQQAVGKPFPTDPNEQLWGAVAAVFRSWGNPRAEVYRRMHRIPAKMGTAVNVQAMVFGNLGDDSATGVAFTRNPSTGAKELFGEYLINAQGEDVVAGVRTPEPLPHLAAAMPQLHAELARVAETLEAHFRDVQDLEFTIQSGTLWMLQTRNAKRTGRAMVKVAVDLVREGVLTQTQAIVRVDPAKIEEVLHSTLDPQAKPKPLAKGLPASPGAVIGRVVFSASQAEEQARRGETVILVRTETSPEDIHGMKAASGILTARGGMTSHAAVVARGMGKCCVTGCSTIKVDGARGRMVVGDVAVSKGDVLTLDGSTGEVFLGAVPLVPAEMSAELAELMSWVDEVRTLRVRTNADTPADAKTARAFGAEGVGLCRTEHMFFAPARILAVREMILAKDETGRRAALAKILPMQREDFVAIFREMAGLPVTIRLLDPPLHEFLPHTAAEIAEVARQLGENPEVLTSKVAELTESNPMLGHRGCRLAISFPEIYDTQVEAIVEAAAIASRDGVKVKPEIMIPFVIGAEELARLRRLVDAAVARTVAATGVAIAVEIGTMIELPRACLVADQIAGHADFFSFGTNDLTQTTFGLSRDDVGTFLPTYLETDLLPRDPFVALDRDGVGQLVLIGVEKGRRAKPGLKIGICGEHGGEPSSIAFCHRAGFDYVSCSPFRVPVARLAAARAALEAP